MGGKVAAVVQQSRFETWIVLPGEGQGLSCGLGAALWGSASWPQVSLMSQLRSTVQCHEDSLSSLNQISI